LKAFAKPECGARQPELSLLRSGAPKSQLEENFTDTLRQLRVLSGIHCTREEAVAVLGFSCIISRLRCPWEPIDPRCVFFQIETTGGIRAAILRCEPLAQSR